MLKDVSIFIGLYIAIATVMFFIRYVYLKIHKTGIDKGKDQILKEDLIRIKYRKDDLESEHIRLLSMRVTDDHINLRSQIQESTKKHKLIAV